MENDELTKVFVRASKIASKVPEAMQQIAFSRALDILLGEGQTGMKKMTKAKKSKSAKKSKEDTEKDPAVEKLLHKIDRTKDPEINKRPTLYGALRLLQIAKDKIGIDGLTPQQIAKVLTDKFRRKTSYQAVHRAFETHSELVDRVPTESGGYEYKIMETGYEYLKEALTDKDVKK